MPPSARFQDDACIGTTGKRRGASYDIPSQTGVLYWLDAQPLQAGRYPAKDRSTITIVASPAPPFTLSGITQWTHTYPGAPTCSPAHGTAVTPPAGVGSPPSGGSTVGSTAGNGDGTATAYTGAPIGSILAIGLSLLVLGVALSSAGTPRRSTQPSTPPAAVRPGRRTPQHRRVRAVDHSPVTGARRRWRPSIASSGFATAVVLRRGYVMRAGPPSASAR